MLPQATDPALQIQLLHYNEARLRPSLEIDDVRAEIEKEVEFRILEEDFVAACRREIADRAAQAPTTPEAFLDWFVALKETGPGQNDPLFPWLAAHATLEHLRWYLTQEVAGEAGFDDLVALTQLKMPTQAKLELARNYWDEMGRGAEVGMHGPMLARLANSLELTVVNEEIVPEALALANLLVALAANRRYAYHSLGALGAVELTAPWRSEMVNQALKRLRLPGRDRQYFALHATLDVEHSLAWNREILVPLVSEDPRRATAIAEGALMRLRAGERCFERYRRELGLPG
jgi:Iron-containing redox enzyme